MSGGWADSLRREGLPPDWFRLRGHVKKRAGGRCEATRSDGTRCTEEGTDCDHVERGSNHDPSNLQWLCKVHHMEKTLAEAAAARPPRAGTRHPGERHPSGLKLY
jgi:5-methylcytosine-specific restriction protein A